MSTLISSFIHRKEKDLQLDRRKRNRLRDDQQEDSRGVCDRLVVAWKVHRIIKKESKCEYNEKKNRLCVYLRHN